MPTKKKAKQAPEKDSVYFLKLVLYIVLGTLWIKFSTPLHIGSFVVNGVPLGLVIGLIFASHDHFQMDRKIEYAVLVLMTIVSYFVAAGIII